MSSKKGRSKGTKRKAGEAPVETEGKKSSKTARIAAGEAAKQKFKYGDRVLARRYVAGRGILDKTPGKGTVKMQYWIGTGIPMSGLIAEDMYVVEMDDPLYGLGDNNGPCNVFQASLMSPLIE